jgi:hypothetical protein
MPIEFPITVNNIEYGQSKTPFDCYELEPDMVGNFVSIRPCAEEYGDQTYLGLYLGQAHISTMTSYNKEKGELKIERSMANPAIYVFDLKKVIFGCESWWGKIESEEQLKEITNDDINNVWYVKALKQMGEKSNESETRATDNKSSE